MANKPCVVITRPAHQAATLAEKLAIAGIETFKLPLMKIANIATDWPEQLALILPQQPEFIFISTNAVRSFLQTVPPERIANKRCIAMGPATSKELQKYGIAAECPQPPFNSEQLLQLFTKQPAQPVVIVRGTQTRGKISEQLKQRNYQLVELICYQQSPAKLSADLVAGALSQPRVDYLIVTSNTLLEYLNNFIEQNLAAAWRQARLVGFSHRLDDLAVKLGFQQAPLITEYAGDDALVATIVKDINERKLI